MKFFRKNKDEDEDQEEVDSVDELEDNKLSRKLKDLKPENKKKRKEPPKPWGKKERLIVGIFFLLTTVSAAVMFLFSHNFKFPGLPKITLRWTWVFNPFGEEIIEIGQKSEFLTDDEKADKVINYFNSSTRPLSGIYGFYVIRLEDGGSYGVGNNEKFQGASLLKFPLMLLAFKMSEEGSYDLNEKYKLKEEDKVKGSGVMFLANAGSEYTFRDLLRLMGKDSDRTAYKVVKDRIGLANLKIFAKSNGMINTDFDTGNTTPKDMATIFKKSWDGSLISFSARDELFGYLTNTSYEEWISAGLPSGVKVVHKFGQDQAVLADAGIVYANKPYVLVIMGQGITKSEADKLYPKISRYVFDVEGDGK